MSLKSRYTNVWPYMALVLVPALVDQVKRVPYTDRQLGMVCELKRYVKW